MMNQDTICAIATAQGGAIGSIRVSGPEAISITSLIFKPAKPDKLFSDQKPYSLTFGRIYDGDEIIDEVLVSLFRTPHSYTGEDSTEITCHGSSYILQQVLQLLIKKGCRMLNRENIRSGISQWKNGFKSGGSRCRFNRILICRYPSASHESDEGWLQQRIN